MDSHSVEGSDLSFLEGTGAGLPRGRRAAETGFKNTLLMAGGGGPPAAVSQQTTPQAGGGGPAGEGTEGGGAAEEEGGQTGKTKPTWDHN